MNRDDVTRMARKVGLEQDGDNFFSPKSDPQVDVHITDLEAFAALVASAEREACAEVCKKHADVYAKLEKNPTAQSAWAACIDNRDAIRVRGNVATNDTSQERVDETTKQRHDAPPQRTWVGLTEEEILDNCESVPDYDIGNYDLIQFAQAIEAKLKEKNT